LRRRFSPRRGFEAGRRGLIDWVSCNICLMHEGTHGLKCRRERTPDLASHTGLRLAGGTPQPAPRLFEGLAVC
jgi:hypothetical protein